MKKIVLIAIAVFTFTFAQAQLTYGVKAGLNMSNVKQDFKDNDHEEATKMLMGFNIGLAVDYEIADAVALQTGLSLSTKGYKVDLDEEYEEFLELDGAEISGYDKYTYTYLEIPIHIAYSITDEFQLYAGPYLGFGIAGKNKWDIEGKYDGETESESDEITLAPSFGEANAKDVDDDNDFFNALDYGFDIGVGYKVMDNLLINAGYSVGMSNLAAEYDFSDFDYDVEYDRADYKMTNNVISISATYYFGQ